MPEQPPQPPQPPRRGGVLGRIMGGPVPPDYFERFVRELEAIRVAVEHTNTLIPEVAAKGQKDLAKAFYEQGYSGQASQPEASGPANDPHIGASAGASVPESAVRQATGQEARRSGYQGRHVVDEREAESGGYARTGGGASTPSGLVPWKNWEEGITKEHLQRGALEIPRSEGGHFTAADLFNFLGDSFKGSTAKRMERSSNEQADIRRQLFGPESVNLSAEEQQSLSDRFQAPAEDRRTAFQGKAGALLSWAGEQAPKYALAKQYLGRAGIMASPSALEAQGAQLGVSPQGGNISIGGIGGRIPFLNPAAMAGINREGGIIMDRMDAGINGDQARFIYDQLNAHGFRQESDQRDWDRKTTPGHFFGKLTANDADGVDNRMRTTPDFDEMKDALKNITKAHPELLNEQTVALMEKATRAGATSLKDFTHTMNRVSKVAKETGYSFEQLQRDMDAAGEVNEQQGGTHYQGQKSALDFMSLTKLPSALAAPLMQNGMVQTMGVQQTGLMPWEQGLMTGQERAHAASGSISQTWKSLGKMPERKIDLGNGFSRTVSSDDRKLAMMHTLYPELPVDKLKQMVKDGKTVESRAALEDQARAWSTTAGKDKGNAVWDEHNMKGGWGAIRKQMATAGFTADEIKDVEKSGTDKKGGFLGIGGHHLNAAEQASERFKKIQKIVDEKGDKIKPGQNPNEVLIKLDEKAKKKGFFLDNKDKARAGEATVNLPFGSGPSPSPFGGP